MNKIKAMVVAVLMMFILVGSVPAQNPRREARKEARREQRLERRQEQRREQPRFRPAPPVVQPRVQPRIQPRVVPRYEQRRPQPRFQRRHRGPRIVIVPSFTFRFPRVYRGYRVTSWYEYGYRDGFYRGRQDFRYGYPCDPDFQFDYRRSANEQYRLGFLAGYEEGCRF